VCTIRIEASIEGTKHSRIEATSIAASVEATKHPIDEGWKEDSSIRAIEAGDIEVSNQHPRSK
jgi:hypothetical protein